MNCFFFSFRKTWYVCAYILYNFFFVKVKHFEDGFSIVEKYDPFMCIVYSERGVLYPIK